MPDLRVRVDEWVLPSHTQAARVAEGSLDLAIAWIEEVPRATLPAAFTVTSPPWPPLLPVEASA